MIGPHEGRELELMLAGEKKLAVFSDFISDDGDTDEAIIPEKAFRPHVEVGQIMRMSKDIPMQQKNNKVVRVVCFCLPGEEWRALFYLWLKENVYSQSIAYHSSHDEIVGSLLGYSSQDIDDFLASPLACI